MIKSEAGAACSRKRGQKGGCCDRKGAVHPEHHLGGCGRRGERRWGCLALPALEERSAGEQRRLSPALQQEGQAREEAISHRSLLLSHQGLLAGLCFPACRVNQPHACTPREIPGNAGRDAQSRSKARVTLSSETRGAEQTKPPILENPFPTFTLSSWPRFVLSRQEGALKMQLCPSQEKDLNSGQTELCRGEWDINYCPGLFGAVRLTQALTGALQRHQ